VGNAIQQLISLVESEEYCYSQVTHNFKNRIHGVMDSWDESVKTKAKIIVKKDMAMECYDSSYKDKSKINELVKNGYALLLSEQSINRCDNENISFYTSKDGQVVCHVDFGRFNYIEKFINNMVQYRFQNKLLDFTEKDILLFMKDFVIKHKNIIIKNHTSKIKEKLLNFEIK